MAVRPFDPATQQMPFKALLDRVFKTRWGTWVAINIGQRIDPYLMRATRGRVRISFTAPTILLTHTGAIDRCISNRYSWRPPVYWGHATEGDAGGVGAEAAAGGAAPRGRAVTGDGGSASGGRSQCRLAMAGYVSAPRFGGLGSDARVGPAAETHGAAA